MADDWTWRDDLKSFVRWQPLQSLWDWFWGTVLGKAVVAGVMAILATAIGYFKGPIMFHAGIGAFVACAFIAALSIISNRSRRKRGFHESPLIVVENGMLKWKVATLKQVANQHFLNDTVQLDGTEYLNCVFEHCTLVYEGTAPTSMIDCQGIRHEGQTSLIVRTSHPIVVASFAIYLGLTGIPPIRPLGWKFEPKN
jgi:hypothetical protein